VSAQLLEVLKAVVERDGLWVPIETYLAMHPSETKEGVYTRRGRGFWKDGVECKVIKGAGLWINLLAVNRWASNAKCESRKESPSDTTPPDDPKASASPSSSAASSAANDSTSRPHRRISGTP
jgi:hypothetical protein